MTVRISEYPVKWDILDTYNHKLFPNGCPDKWIIRISEAWLYNETLEYINLTLNKYTISLSALKLFN